MHPRGLRLNVGQVETLTFDADEARFLFEAPLGEMPSQRYDVSSSDAPFYRSVPVDSGCCFVRLSDVASIPETLRAAHDRYIRSAASFKRKSPFKASFSPAVLEEIETVLGRTIPRPVYFSADASTIVHRPADELDPAQPIVEGARYTITVNAYERNPQARAACISHYGATCSVCGFNFAAVYGALAAGFIHVHHIRPLSEIGEAYEVNPVMDLRPVCPNCHSVIHMGNSCRSIEEVRALIAAARQAS